MSGGRPPGRRPRLIAEQQELAASAVPMIRNMARALATIRPDADEDDLASAAIESVTRGVRTYDPAKNDSFEAFVWLCASRAMFAVLRGNRHAGEPSLSAALSAGLALAATLRDESDPYADGPKDMDGGVARACDETALGYALGHTGAAECGGEDQMIAALDAQRAVEALARFPEADRRLIELRLVGQESFRSIGAALGMSRAKASRRAEALLGKLRRALTDPDVARP